MVSELIVFPDTRIERGWRSRQMVKVGFKRTLIAGREAVAGCRRNWCLLAGSHEGTPYGVVAGFGSRKRCAGGVAGGSSDLHQDDDSCSDGQGVRRGGIVVLLFLSQRVPLGEVLLVFSSLAGSVKCRV